MVKLRPDIVLFGDSITQQSFQPGGWGARLADAYNRHADIVLRGYSGYNTAWALATLPDLREPMLEAPALVTVMLGANDANCPAPLRKQGPEASRQHVPIDEYKANLKTIVTTIQSWGSTARRARVLLITPPPVHTETWAAFCVKNYGVNADAEPNRNHEYTAEYAKACVAVGAELGVAALDMHGAFLARPDWPTLLVDGLHPSATGGEFMYETIVKTVQTTWPELTPLMFGADPSKPGLPLDFPDHKDPGLDRGDVSKIFKAHAAAKK